MIGLFYKVLELIYGVFHLVFMQLLFSFSADDQLAFVMMFVVLPLLSASAWLGFGNALAGAFFAEFLPQRKQGLVKDKKTFTAFIGYVAPPVFCAVLSLFFASVLGLLLASFFTREYSLWLSLLFPFHSLFMGTENLLMYYAFLGLFALMYTWPAAIVWWSGQGALRIAKKQRGRISVLLGWVFFLLSALVVFTFVTEESDQWYMPNTLHAAIKNTCLLDPRRVNCPHRLEDIAIIEPKEYAHDQARCQLFYKYLPDTNDYVFLTRCNRTSAVLFSQLLLKSRGGSHGGDYQILEVSTLGRDEVKDLPAFAQEFRYLPEWGQ